MNNFRFDEQRLRFKPRKNPHKPLSLATLMRWVREVKEAQSLEETSFVYADRDEEFHEE